MSMKKQEQLWSKCLQSNSLQTPRKRLNLEKFQIILDRILLMSERKREFVTQHEERYKCGLSAYSYTNIPCIRLNNQGRYTYLIYNQVQSCQEELSMGSMHTPKPVKYYMKTRSEKPTYRVTCPEEWDYRFIKKKLSRIWMELMNIPLNLNKLPYDQDLRHHLN